VNALAAVPYASTSDDELLDIQYSSPRVISVEEHMPTPIPAHLILRDGRLDVFASVAKRGYFTVKPSEGPLTLQAGGYIGVIPLNPRVTIDVKPRVPVDNLSRVLRISGAVPTDIFEVIRRYEKEPELYPSLVDIYARAMTSYVDDIVLRGSFREYQRYLDATSFPRGRILMGEAAKTLAARGLAHKVQASWFQRTADNDVNRCLKYALWLLIQVRMGSRHVKGSRELIRGLGRAYRRFDGVTLDLSKHFLRNPMVRGTEPLPMLRGYYRNPLVLALAIIHQHAVSLDGSGGVALPSIVLNMASAFESYLLKSLQSTAEAHSWPVNVLNGNHKLTGGGGGKPLLDEGPSNVEATPDIVLGRPGNSSSFALVVEVKYKPGKLDRDDLNQVVAYGFSYKCPSVVLVQPFGKSGKPARGLHRLGSINNMNVYRYVFDLGAKDLEAEESAFGAEMVKLCSPAPVLTATPS